MVPIRSLSRYSIISGYRSPFSAATDQGITFRIDESGEGRVCNFAALAPRDSEEGSMIFVIENCIRRKVACPITESTLTSTQGNSHR